MFELIIDSIGTIIANMILFLIVPFLWWFIKHRKNISFVKWIGLKKPELKSKWWIIIIFIILYCFFYLFDFTVFMDQKSLELLQTSESVSANIYDGLGWIAIIPALLTTFIANGLCEEILFRGFICKRLCSKFGKITGVIIQGILFGLMHNMIYLLSGIDVSFQFHIVVFIFTGMGGFLLGMLNEKIYNGSIIPSVLLHGLGNFINNLSIMF